MPEERCWGPIVGDGETGLRRRRFGIFANDLQGLLQLFEASRHFDQAVDAEWPLQSPCRESHVH